MARIDQILDGIYRISTTVDVGEFDFQFGVGDDAHGFGGLEGALLIGVRNLEHFWI